MQQSFMWLSKIFTAVQHGEMVYWDFTTQSGVSFIGELQTSAFYPIALIFGIFVDAGFPSSFDLFLIFHFLIAALGTTIYCRRLGLSFFGSIAAAIVFSFGSTFTDRAGGQPNLFCGLSYIPWMALALHISVSCSTQRERLVGSITFGLAAFLSFTAGHVHNVILGGFVALSLILSLLPCFLRDVSIFYQRLGLGLLVGIGVALTTSLPQLVAMIEYLYLSYKWYGPGYTTFPHVVPPEIFHSHGIRFYDIKTMVTGGSISPPDGGTLFITKTGLVLIIAGLFYSIFHKKYRRIIIPALFVCLFSIVFSFGIVADHIPVLNMIRDSSRWLFAYAFGASLLIAVGMDSVMDFLNSRSRKNFSTFLAIIPVIIILSVFYETSAYFKHLEKPVEGPESALNELNSQAVRKLLNVTKQELPLYRYFAQDEEIPPNLGNLYPVLSSHGHRSSRTILYHTYFDFNPLGTTMDKLGVKWWITRTQVPGLPLLGEYDGIFFYERPSALPVFWLLGPEETRIKPSFEDINWGANSVKVTFGNTVSGRLIFAQTNYPGFIAYADNVPLIVQSYDNLMSVYLPFPTKEVVFKYSPSWMKPTFFIMLLTLVSCCVVILYVFYGALARLRCKDLTK